ncbi:hypothetical protein DCAR_0310726 [Daucus carota subsp. sativus]|uniref:Uncharacterized protein n=1 Tax=Daucus carota subsp. sativus TaxID=79200 RepID=A0A166A4Q7_DAUCS|nr:hypothetical protein DCAR_0310726 [Daucus carota subsp. sativus]
MQLLFQEFSVAYYDKFVFSTNQNTLPTSLHYYCMTYSTLVDASMHISEYLLRTSKSREPIVLHASYFPETILCMFGLVLSLEFWKEIKVSFFSL